jgi:hypothetical protein
MAPDSALLTTLARAQGGFDLDDEQAGDIGVSLAAVEQALARVSLEALRAEEPPLEFVPRLGVS